MTSSAQTALENAGLIPKRGPPTGPPQPTLDTVGDLTIFVPSNDAFRAIEATLQGASIDAVRDILRYHAVTGSVVFSSDVTNTTVKTVAGPELTLSVVNGEVFVNKAKVILPDVLLSNGVMHIIDT